MFMFLPTVWFPSLGAHLNELPDPPALGLFLLGFLGIWFMSNRYAPAPAARCETRSSALPRAGLAPVRSALAALLVLVPGSAKASPILSEIFFNPAGADDQLEWVEIFNDGATAIDLSGYSLGWGGADYTTGTLQLSGIVAPGQYFVVGGPISNASNGNPVFDQAMDFGPNLENSGIFTPADGVALFNVPAALITATTDPIDAFIYQGAFFSPNSNNLRDENGPGGVVDFTIGVFATGFSAELSGGSWQQQASPTPGSAPVPEPGTATSLLLGLILLAAVRRRTP